MDILEARDRATDATTKIARAITVDSWDNESACEGWSIRYVLNHLTAENLWIPDLLAGKTIEEVGDAYDGDVLGDDPAEEFASTAVAANDAFREPGALERQVPVSYGPIPGEVYAGHHFIDLLIHGWDMAWGVDGDTTMDPEVVEFCIAVVEPQIEGIQGSGAFKVIDIPSDAGPQTRLLAMLGREG